MIEIQHIDTRQFLNKCKECPLPVNCHPLELTYVPAEIVGKNPQILFIAEAPGPQEVKIGRPLIGPSGTLLREFVDPLFPTSGYILYNVTACHPATGPIRTPEKSEIDYCQEHVFRLIDEYHIKLVVVLGNSAAIGLIPETTKKTTVASLIKNSPFKLHDTLFVVDYHPSYIIRNGGKEAKEYGRWITRLRRYLHPFSDESNKIDFEKIGQSEDTVKWAIHQPEDLPKILNFLRTVKRPIGFDFEALSVNPWEQWNKPTGFCLVFRTGPKAGRGFFVSLRKRQLCQEEWRLLCDFFEECPPHVYNLKYEKNVIRAQCGRNLDFHDVYALCKIDGHPEGLKDNSRFYLGQELGWEDQVHLVTDGFKKLFKLFDKFESDVSQISLLKNGRLDEWVETLLKDKKLEKKVNTVSAQIDRLLVWVSREELIQGMQWYPYEWGACPERIIAEYCVFDGYYTLKIEDILLPKYDQQYPLFLSETELAANFEAYGLCWDDRKASELEEFYSVAMIDSLRKLIQFLNISDELKMEALYLNGATHEETIRKLKDIFNPQSNTPESKEKFWSVYKNSTTMEYVTFVHLETEILQHEYLHEDELLILFKKDDLQETIKRLKEYANTHDQKTKGAIYGILGGVGAALQEYFSSFKQDYLTYHYKGFIDYGEVNIDDESQWPQEFALLFYLKKFKKIQKLLGTYIYGETGRESVSIVQIEDPLRPPIRLKNYTPQSILQPGQQYIMNTGYRENVAETRRWNSRIHTVPANCEINEIYIPRAVDRLLIHGDLSQAEVRVMAFLANEPALLEALQSGLDIHRYTASQIYKVPMDDVTPAWRKAAKAAVFSLLYGKGIIAFAREFFSGDLNKALQFFDDFFTLYPRVKTFIDTCHEVGFAQGFVTSLFNDPLFVDLKKYRGNAARRKFQNFPIQGTASHLAARGITFLKKNIEKKALNAILNGFTHDAFDSDAYIPHIPQLLPLIRQSMVGEIYNTYGILLEVDYECGIHKSMMMGLKDTPRQNVYDFHCASITFEPIIEKLQTYTDVEYVVKKEEVKRESVGEIFAEKRSFSRYLGQDITYLHGELSFAD